MENKKCFKNFNSNSIFLDKGPSKTMSNEKKWCHSSGLFYLKRWIHINGPLTITDRFMYNLWAYDNQWLTATETQACFWGRAFTPSMETKYNNVLRSTCGSCLKQSAHANNFYYIVVTVLDKDLELDLRGPDVNPHSAMDVCGATLGQSQALSLTCSTEFLWGSNERREYCKPLWIPPGETRGVVNEVN